MLQKTALEWFSAGECSIDGCTSPARLEIDHVADWADTQITTLAHLASPCGHHHDLKTHHGYTFGPGSRPGNGGSSHPTRAHPGGTDPPAGAGQLDDDRPAELMLLHGDGPDRPPPSPDTTQGDLFDTG